MKPLLIYVFLRTRRVLPSLPPNLIYVALNVQALMPSNFCGIHIKCKV